MIHMDVSYSVMATVAPKSNLNLTQERQHYLGVDPMRAVSELMTALTNYSGSDNTMTVSVRIDVTDPTIVIPEPVVEPEPDPVLDEPFEEMAHTHD